MKFIISFEDDESKAHMRSQHMQQHLKFLQDNQSLILAAGPLFDADSNSPAGGLWLVEAPGVDDVQKLIHDDPFWPTGLRKNVSILKWGQVFADGKRLLP